VAYDASPAGEAAPPNQRATRLPQVKLILLGAPGSGKGTQGNVLAERYGITHVSSGEILRRHVEAGTEIGEQVEQYMERGDLVPDRLLLEVMTDEVFAAVETGGYILDGVPRTLEQALAAYEIGMLRGITADAALHLEVPDDIVVERLAARATKGRTDDADPEIIGRRLDVYHRQTQPLLDFYESRGVLRTVDAARPPDEVSASLFTVVDRLR